MTIFERIQAVLTFRNGTEIELSEHDIISASIKRQCCSDGKFEIGGVYAAQLSIKCKVPGTNSFRIRGAKIQVFSKYSNEQDFISRGIFWITSAVKTGEIYSVTAVDNIGWLDLDNYTTDEASGGQSEQVSVWENFTKYFREILINKYHADYFQLHELLNYMTIEVSPLAERMTGLQDVLQWGHYVEGNGNDLYCNHFDGNDNTNDKFNAYGLFADSDKFFSGTPIDLYKKLSEISAGFVYARPEDGFLTLGQFGQKKFYKSDPENPATPVLVNEGTAEIYPEHMEQDSFEFADFSLLAFQVAFRNNRSEKNEIGDHYPIDARYYYPHGWSAFPFDTSVPYVFTIENNPAVDAYVSYHIMHDAGTPRFHKDNLFTLCESTFLFLNNAEKRPFVPFQCKVHKPERYHLGQRIDFYNGNAEIICKSVITSIQWTFRGGYTLSCSGKDERVLAGCARISKADKAIRSVNAGYFYKKQEEQEG